MLWHFINPSEICILNIIVVQRNERSESTEQHQKNSQGSNAKKSSDFLITFFWLLCCLLRVMRIMFSVRTGVRQFYIILKWESPFKAPLLPLTASAARLFRRTTCLIFIITAMKIARSQHIWHLFFFFFTCFSSVSIPPWLYVVVVVFFLYSSQTMMPYRLAKDWCFTVM